MNSVRGKVTNLVEGYSRSSNNYDVVWDTLKLHYGDENSAKHSLYIELQNLLKATKEVL